MRNLALFAALCVALFAAAGVARAQEWSSYGGDPGETP